VSALAPLFAPNRPDFRHPGESRDPVLAVAVGFSRRQLRRRAGSFASAAVSLTVIPAKAGIHLDLAVAPDFSRIKLRYRRVWSASAAADLLLLTSGILPSAPSGPPSAFALLLQRSERPKRSRQEKGRPELRAPRWSRGVRVGRAGSSTAHPCADEELARIHARDPSGFSPDRRRCATGPGIKSEAEQEPSKSAHSKAKSESEAALPLPPFHGGRCRRQMGANGAKAVADQKSLSHRTSSESPIPNPESPQQ
jgi:hypothetical protein